MEHRNINTVGTIFNDFLGLYTGERPVGIQELIQKYDRHPVLMGLLSNVDSIIYGIMFNFIVSAVINKMMFGFSSSMLAMIVTDDGKAACAEIDRVADRGSTILQGHGGYGGQPKDVVLCACSNKQLYEIEHAVQAIDPGCFIIMLQSNEVHGEGFRQLELGKNENKSE